MVKELLIGDNAFIGVSHLSQARARERQESLGLEQAIAVIETAFSSGASGFTFSTHPTNFRILEKLRDEGRVNKGFDLYPVLPYTEGYVRIANEKGTAGLIKETMSRMPLSGKARAFIDTGISALTFDVAGLLKAYTNMELASYLNAKPKNAKLRAVLLHEVVTDLGLSFQAKDLFESYIDHVREDYGAKPGFVTRNFPKFVNFCETTGLPLKDVVVMTPFNRLGFQMNPSKQGCEESLRSLSSGAVIAVSILAGGYLRLGEAVEYLNTLSNISGVAVGISSRQHARDTFKALRGLAQSAAKTI